MKRESDLKIGDVLVLKDGNIYLALKIDDLNINAVKLKSLNSNEKFCFDILGKNNNVINTFDLSKIYEINEKSIVNILYNIKELNNYNFEELLSKFVVINKAMKYVDFSNINLKIKEGSIVKVNNFYYLLLKKRKNDTYISYALEKRNEGKIGIFRRTYDINKKMKILNTNDIEYVITYIDNDLLKEYKCNKNIK